MDNVGINNIRNDSKSSLYCTNSLIENNIVSHLSSIEPSLRSQPSPSSDYEEQLLSVNKLSCSLLYYSSPSFLATLSPNASCSLSINIPVTYYPADSCHQQSSSPLLKLSLSESLKPIKTKKLMLNVKSYYVYICN
jgi:hypothetical protein